MVIDLRALSTKQIDFGVLPHGNHWRHTATDKLNNENNNLNNSRHYNLLTVCMTQILAR